MPSQRPRAQFEPIPHNLNITRLVDAYDHFEFCPRIEFADITHNGIDRFEKLVKKHVIADGKPLVVEGFQDILDPWTFSAKWLKDNVGDKVENAGDLNSKEPIPLTIRHYLNNINAVTNQHFKVKDGNARPPQRIYLKDIDCPEVWKQKLAEVIPPFLFYLNESTGEIGGPGASVDKGSTVPGKGLGRGIAPAGDLMSCLPEEMRAENLMCYIGHEGTYTPAHREMCATMGHNIMVEASKDISEDGKPERPGSSIWFMTEAKDRQTVAEFWLSKLGHDIEVENHFAQINSWKVAPFKVYIVDQRPGDFILIPPLAPHQVWNRGTRTMKVAWNRTTSETLGMAISEALPKARIVCRDEQYKNKAIIYFTLCKYSELLSNAKAQADKLQPQDGYALLYRGKTRTLQRDFKRLLILFKDVMLSEMFSLDGSGEKCEYIEFDSNVTCAYCRGNIFNRFLSCDSCKDGLGLTDPEPYDVCMECYAMGRSCYCISGHKWIEQFKWKDLTTKYDAWRRQLIELLGDTDREIPLALQEERRRRTAKTLAEVVSEQLKRRPFRDPSKPQQEDQVDEPSDQEVVVGDHGMVKKRVVKRSKTWLKNHALCHICKWRHEKWKMARCTRCDRWWCFGALFRGHDDMPLDVMQNPDWECAHCEGICFGGTCRRDPRQQPFQPKGTLLGHDTKKIADARSVEVLVDFSVSNLNWIRDEDGAEESVQMRRAREEGERAEQAQQANGLDDDEDLEVDGYRITTGMDPMIDNNDAFLDPELRDEAELASRLSQFNQSLPLASNAFPAVNQPAFENTSHPHPHEGNGSYLYPDPNNINAAPELNGDGYQPFGPGAVGYGDNEPEQATRKRARLSEGDSEIRMTKAKKARRTTELGAEAMLARPGNEASKQYQVVKERKALEEARRQGRFIAVNAALKGKKNLVRLRVSADRLAAIVAQSSSAAKRVTFAQSTRAESEIGSPGPDLLRSDVRPVQPAQAPAKPSGKPIGRPKGRKRKATGSDTNDEVASGDEAAMPETVKVVDRTDGQGRRRISAYLEARYAGEDLPNELGLKEPRKKTSSGTPTGSKSKTGPTGRPNGSPKKNNLPPTSTPIEIEDDTSSPPANEYDSVIEEEKNRLAKLEAYRNATGSNDGLDDSIDAIAAAAFEKATTVAPTPPPQTSNMMTAPVAPVANMGIAPPSVRKMITGPGGRRGKIVSAASKLAKK